MNNLLNWRCFQEKKENHKFLKLGSCFVLIALTILLNAIPSFAKDFNIAVTGGWDSIGLDIYKLHLIGLKGGIDIGAGGFALNDIADDAASDTCGGYLPTCEADGNLITINAFLRNNNIYVGVGYSRMDFDSRVGGGGIYADGNIKNATIDAFAGIMTNPNSTLFVDLRGGYRFDVENEFNVTSGPISVTGQAGNMLEGAFVSLHLGIAF